MLTLEKLSACLVTKHNKVEYITAPLQQAFGWDLQALDNFNTDLLGTFSGESERTLTATECAIYKAKKALTLSNSAIGLGSEGSFNPDPFGMMTVNQELIACVHRQHGLLAVGQAIRPVNVRTWTLQTSEKQQLTDIIEQLPTNQALIMRAISDDEDTSATDSAGIVYGDVYKGLFTQQQIEDAFLALQVSDATARIEVCYDLRAMNCPERQITITSAAANLVERLQSACPQCQQLDFIAETRISGLPCETCGLPTNVTKAFQATCRHCGFQSLTPVQQLSAETVNCQFCNP